MRGFELRRKLVDSILTLHSNDVFVESFEFFGFLFYVQSYFVLFHCYVQVLVVSPAFCLALGQPCHGLLGCATQSDVACCKTLDFCFLGLQTSCITMF